MIVVFYFSELLYGSAQLLQSIEEPHCESGVGAEHCAGGCVGAEKVSGCTDIK